jgi:sortase A
MRKTRIDKLDAVLLAVGLLCFTIYAGYRIHSGVASRAALETFTKLHEQSLESSTSGVLPESRNLDFALWSAQRIETFRSSRAANIAGPIAVLTIERISLAVPVFDGTDDLILNRGVGRIIGTARPGHEGNIGIAGHRDGFFRGLKDVQTGDRVVLTTLHEKSIYAVDRIEIVTPEDVSVLQPKEHPALTLVTCYPFYLVGHAPKRFIVHAARVAPAAPHIRKTNLEVRSTDKWEATK